MPGIVTVIKPGGGIGSFVPGSGGGGGDGSVPPGTLLDLSGAIIPELPLTDTSTDSDASDSNNSSSGSDSNSNGSGSGSSGVTIVEKPPVNGSNQVFVAISTDPHD